MGRTRYVVTVLPPEDHSTLVPPPGKPEGLGGGFSVPTPPVRGEEPVHLVESAPQPPVHHAPRIHTPASSPQPATSSVEMIEARRARIEKLLLDENIQTSRREEPRIAKPRVVNREVLQEQHSSKEEAFRHDLAQTRQVERIENFYKKQKIEERQQRESKRRFKLPRLIPPAWTRSLGMALVLVVVFLGAVSFAGAAFVQAQIRLTEQDVKNLGSDLQQSQWQSANERVLKLEKKRKTALWLYTFVRPLSRLALGQEKATSIDQLFEVSDTAIRVLKSSLTMEKTFSTGVAQFTGKEEGKSLDAFSQLTGESEALFTDLSTLQAGVDKLENPFNVEVIDSLKTRVDQDIPKIRKSLIAAQKIGFTLPDILGAEGKKQYLVLLQNNMELRPTGGFIGSFGILTVQSGKFLDFHVEDVYAADGQLNGYVTPPAEIVTYLGEARWYLRDVNWNPDFPTTSQQALWFLDKERGIKADGVIGINLDVAQKLLAVTGPIELVDYKEVITKDNLYERAQLHSEMNFFPGSTQKRDFLSAVANELFNRLMKDQTPKLQVAQALMTAADEAQLQFSSNSTSVSSVFSTLGWDGSVRTPQCPQPFNTEKCFVDTVMQVEANVGVNKANQYVTRDITHAVKLSGGVAHHARDMKIENTAKSNAWPEGVYKTYLRLYVSKEAQLTGVMVNGAAVDMKTVKVSDEDGKKVFGMYLEVPIQKSQEVLLSYDVPLPQAAPLVYALFDQKQSGTTGDKVQHSLTSEDRNVMTVAPEPKQINGREVLYTSDRKTHDFMAVELQ